MTENWGELVRNYRKRHSLTQHNMADILKVSQKTVSRWERGEDHPNMQLRKHLRDLIQKPTSTLSSRLFQSVSNCPIPRALSRLPNITLMALSRPAIAKRPSMVDWIGRDLTPIATGVLREMLDDGALQRSIVSGDVACVRSTTESVLRSPEHASIGMFETTITYFFHDGTLYSDAISAPAALEARCGYYAVAMDEAVGMA
jgi:DNA-binding XRE family transcriptional regulator